MSVSKERCEKELCIEKHFGIKPDDYEAYIMVKFSQMVDLLCAFEQAQLSAPNTGKADEGLEAVVQKLTILLREAVTGNCYCESCTNLWNYYVEEKGILSPPVSTQTKK